MNSQSMGRFAWSFLVGVISPFAISELTEAAQIARSLDIPGTRGRISANEGYLSFRDFGPTFNGEERTGWTDVRHPAFFDGDSGPQILVRDNRGIGYDRSDFHVDVRNIITTDSNGITAMPDIERDYNFANQIYAQLGISVLNAGNVSATYNNVTFPINATPLATDPPNPPNIEVDNVLAANRAAPVTINNYYVRDLADALAFAVTPEDTIAPNQRPNHGLIIGEKDISNDDFAHELGHFLLDEYRFAGESVHSPEATDVQNEASNNPADIPKGLGNGAPKQPGQPVGNIGGLDRFQAFVDKPPLPAGGPTTRQIHGIFDAAEDGNFYVQRQDNSFTSGNRADFDWVEDNILFELAGVGLNGDNLADNHDGFDFLIWEIGNIVSLPFPDHDHGDWLMPSNPEERELELSLGRFNGSTFRIVDVISQIARYADNDVAEANIPATGEVQGEWSPRQSALDYFVEFFDGNNWQSGKPIIVFEDGWTFRSLADDYVVRWLAPFQATSVRIGADPGELHDGNTQIDAIIAGNSRRFARYISDPTRPVAGNDPELGMLASATFDGENKLSFDNVIAQSLFLNGGLESVGDPLEGATFLIDDVFLIGANSEGWEFSDTTLDLIIDGTTVLTADVIDSFLFAGSLSHPEFDSQFQGLLSNIFIDNTLGSPYLDELQAFIDAGGLSFFSFSSDILSATDNLTIAGSSEGVAWGQDGAKVPEPSSIISMFAVGGLGLLGLQKKRQATGRADNI